MRYPPEQQNGGAAYPAAPGEISRYVDGDHEQGSASDCQGEVIARGVGLAPSGARALWAWIVGRCPYCGQPHLHRGGPAGGLRRAGCGLGMYRVTARRKGRRAPDDRLR